MRANPLSTTKRMPGTVSDVSATLVSSTMRRALVRGWKICSCSACDRRLRRIRGFRVRRAGTPARRPGRAGHIRPRRPRWRRSGRVLRRPTCARGRGRAWPRSSHDHAASEIETGSLASQASSARPSRTMPGAIWLSFMVANDMRIAKRSAWSALAEKALPGT
ncbi:hypothetical protein G6F59_015595 [Rhizopus arrhizus]|nr:hypothetical protein G6F59_015595 [Rhizopus arrhizus]